MTIALVDFQAQRGFLAGFEHMPSGGVGEGKVFSYGKFGDIDPGSVMRDVEVRNHGTIDVYASRRGLRGAVGTTDYRQIVKAGKSGFFAGDLDNLCIYNVNGSGAVAPCGVIAEQLGRADSRDMNGHPGEAEWVYRMATTANAAVTKTRTNYDPRTITGIYAWSKTVCTSAAGTYLLTATKTTVAGVSRNLLASSLSLDGLTTVTLGTASLTATTAYLDLDPGETLILTATSNNADLVQGDLMLAVAWTLR